MFPAFQEDSRETVEVITLARPSLTGARNIQGLCFGLELICLVFSISYLTLSVHFVGVINGFWPIKFFHLLNKSVFINKIDLQDMRIKEKNYTIDC